MNFTALKNELLARGFDSLGDTRAGQFINWARAELDELEPWPYREASVTGVAPMIVTDLGQIEQVLDMTSLTSLAPAEYRDLVLDYGDLSITGTPYCYYLAWPSGVPEVATYPVSTDTIGVQYWKTTPDLVGGTDTPLVPSRFHHVIVDIAERMALRERNEDARADQLQQEIDRSTSLMTQTLLQQQLQGPRFIQVTPQNW